MMELIKHKTHFDFASKFGVAFSSSAIVVLACLGLILFGKGLNYGVDFRGGAEIQVKFFDDVGPAEVRLALDKGKVGANVQNIGDASENEYLVKMQTEDDNLNLVTTKVGDIFKQNFSNKKFEIRKTDIVGPKAGKQLRVSGFMAMLWSIIAIMIYVALRFDFKYAPGAVLALLHDAVITVGIFALLGKEFNLQIVAAVLAIIGYSVNDTVIVYDRVREHEMKSSGTALRVLINRAINETLSRTVLTSGATLLVCIIMYFFGGKSIEDFFFAMSVGIITGTFSSVFIAAPVTLILDHYRKKKA